MSYRLSTLAISLLFATQAHTAQFTLGSITSEWKTQQKQDSQIILPGVVSMNDQDGGTVLVTNHTSNSFDIRFAEWPYSDNSHLTESVPILQMTPGRHLMADGSIWEVGTFELESTALTHKFTQPMPQTPYVFLGVHNANTTEAFALRASNINQYGFTAIKQFQELATNTEKATDTISYLAVYAPQKGGQTDDGIRYHLDQVELNDQPKQVDTFDVFLQEEHSKDSETTHTDEVANVLKVGNMLFAQDISYYGQDTHVIRAHYDAHPAPVPTYASCKEIVENDPSASNGFYEIDIDGYGPQTPFTTYCDNEAGGWTLVGIRHVKGIDYSDKVNLTNRFYETQNITGFDQNYHLTDAQWVTLKNNSSDIKFIMPINGAYGIAEISVLNGANCIPLSDTLGITPGQTGNARQRLFWHETSGCSGSGRDYSMLNYSNIYVMGGLYKETNISSYVSEQTTYIYVR
ncbi:MULTISPECIES: fibrinogen-like YCDxxxxGGGW domain-containing protein [Pseudoalteromonas]|uniref:Fibrinogen C-terminal domain-containing protein n=1 Tax=Pseudoalteromonas viridis TaxID=339617 RepID=A0ABX7V6Q7_9GAMM|nr:MULTISPECIES: fibrinogen-like YCDxxxxGGGW domain-containing protein [Pseudoalteromonas]QTL35122.1 hypothetical protein J5X90_16580 [Pseudoalteromonas viridis]